MTLPKIHVCGYCGKAFKMEATKRLAPGEHVAKIDVSREPCPSCKEKYKDGGVSQSDTAPKQNEGESVSQ